MNDCDSLLVNLITEMSARQERVAERETEKDLNTLWGPMRDMCLCTPGCQGHRSVLQPLPLAQHPKQEKRSDLAQILHQSEQRLSLQLAATLCVCV